MQQFWYSSILHVLVDMQIYKVEHLSILVKMFLTKNSVEGLTTWISDLSNKYYSIKKGSNCQESK